MYKRDVHCPLKNIRREKMIIYYEKQVPTTATHLTENQFDWMKPKLRLVSDKGDFA